MKTPLRSDRREAIAQGIFKHCAPRKNFRAASEQEQDFYRRWAEAASREDALHRYGLKRSDFWPSVKHSD